MPNRPGPVVRFALGVPRVLYRQRLGWLVGRRFMLLEHAGRRSGRVYQTVVEVLRYDRASGRAVVMAGWGRESDWYRNVEAAGRATITVGSHTMPVTARVLGDQEAAAVVAGYERRNRWMRPLMYRILGRLAGVDYDGTEDKRLAVVRQLPLIEFTPSPPGP